MCGWVSSQAPGAEGRASASPAPAPLAPHAHRVPSLIPTRDLPQRVQVLETHLSGLRLCAYECEIPHGSQALQSGDRVLYLPLSPNLIMSNINPGRAGA